MKIALDGYVLRFPRTGIVNYGFALARGYRERLAEDEFRILLGDRNVTADEIREFLASGDVVPILEGNRETLIEWFSRKISGNVFREYMPGLGSAIKRATEGFDVYHSTDWFIDAPRHAKLKVMTYYDLTAILHSQFHEELNIKKERMKLERVSDYDYVFCISESTRNDLIQHASIDPSRVIVNYIDTDPIFNRHVYVPREDIYAKYKIPEGSRYVLSVSTIEPRKNFQQVLDAFGEFVRANPSEPYVLVCSGMWGWKNDDLKVYLEQCGFADRVIFTGFADLEDLPSLYHHAECFLYLSLYEGFGLPILEAMKCGCPVICSNTSSMPEVVGNTGITVSPIDVEGTVEAITAIVQDPAKADEMRSAGQSRSVQFSWDSHLENLFEVYRQAL